jgi:hypothetical protein
MLKVFENRALRRLIALKRDEIIGGKREFYNGVLHNLYSSPNIITMITSKKMRWTRHVAPMGRRRMHIGFWWKS